MVPFFCYCLRKHKEKFCFFKFPIKPHLQKHQNISCIGNIANLSKTLDLTQFFFFFKLNVVKTNTTKIRIIELKHEKKKSFMNICYIVCYVRNKHRQKSVKKEPSIQTETLIDTYIRKLTKSLKYKITWSQISALFYRFLTSKRYVKANRYLWFTLMGIEV